jgi:hypothetical protein
MYSVNPITYHVMSCHACIILPPYLTCLSSPGTPHYLNYCHAFAWIFFCSCLFSSVEVSVWFSSLSSLCRIYYLYPPVWDLLVLTPYLLDPLILAQLFSRILLLFCVSFFLPDPLCRYRTLWIRCSFPFAPC